ncbi:MAG: DUF502 domain-containing protein [candidate division Zixibacteria bacterium]
MPLILSKIIPVLKKQFLSGLLVVVPLIVTFFVLRFLFNTLDGILNPLTRDLLGYDIPGLGAVVTILIILLAGIIATNYIGAKLFYWSDRFLVRTPLVRIVYTAAKQLVQSMVAPRARAFSEVAFIEYPRRGMFVIGLLAGKSEIKINDRGEEMRLVFVPSTPTPFTGLVVFVPECDIHRTDLGVEEAMKILVSGGIVVPPEINMEDNPKIKEVVNASGEFIE